MYYLGEFRDINDKLYQVMIFTNISTDGESTDEEPQILKFSADPFVVEYAADDSNIYKPYKLSTASVNLICDSFNTDFICNKKNNTKVILRGWNGEDWDIEWVGYQTPNQYNQSYCRVIDVFTLECQDAFSTCKYFNFENTRFGFINIQEILIDIFTKIGFNYTIYVTNTIMLSGCDNSNILQSINTINSNWCDEDGEFDDYLTVIENLMLTFGLTLITYKDSIIITNADALKDNRGLYYKITLSGVITNTDIEMAYLSELVNLTNNDYSASANTNLSITPTYKKVQITPDEYKSEIVPDLESSDYFYKVFDTGLSNISWLRKPREMRTNHYLQYYYDQSYVVYNAYVYNTIQHQTSMFGSNEDYSEARFSRYTNTTNPYRWSTTQINQFPTSLGNFESSCGCCMINYSVTDYNVEDSGILSQIIQSYPSNYCYYFYTPNPFTGSDGRTPQAMKASDCHTFNQPYNNGNSNYIQPMLQIVTKQATMRKGQYLEIQGDWTFFNNVIPTLNNWTSGMENVNGKGLLAYPQWMYVWAKVIIDGKYLKNEANYSYTWSDTPTWCKLWYGGQGWNKTQKVKTGGALWWKKYKYYGVEDGFGNTFSFIKNTNGADGLVIPLDGIFDNKDTKYTYIDITFNRPVGCCQVSTQFSDESDRTYMFPAQSSILENFNINILDRTDLEYMDIDNERCNNQFTIDMIGDAVDDYGEIKTKLSSNYNKGTSLSTILYNAQGTSIDAANVSARSKLKINNTNTQYINYPEAVVINNIAGSYLSANLVIDLDTHYDVKPYTTFIWDSQFGDRRFIVDSMSINYAYNTKSVRLFHKKYETPSNVYVGNKSKNFRRNGDNLYNDLIPYNKTEITNIVLIPDTLSFSNNTNGEGLLTTDEATDLRDMWIEPNFINGEMNVYVPQGYEDVTVVKDSNGNLKIITI